MRTPYIIDDYVEAINDHTRFIQANYGDGEWSCILGIQGENCNGEHYIRPLQLELIKTLQEPIEGFFWYGSNPGSKLQKAVTQWLTRNNTLQRSWVYKEIISGANVKGNLKGFIKAVRKRPSILIGPKHLRHVDVHKIWNFRAQVNVPSQDAFLAIDRTYKDVQDTIASCDPDLMLVCSGMASKPLIYRLAKQYPYCTIIDMGATLDPYAGVYSRSGYRKEEFQKTNYYKNIKDIIPSNELSASPDQSQDSNPLQLQEIPLESGKDSNPSCNDLPNGDCPTPPVDICKE